MAALLYLLFLSNLLAGDLFPKFVVSPDSRAVGFQQLLATYPEKFSDYAKLMFWSVIAGLSETFVMDLVNRFQEQATTGAP